MSYILDALRKAEAEREGAARLAQGVAASIHMPRAPENSPPPAEMPLSPRGAAPLLWSVAGGSVLLAGVLGWLLLGGKPSVDDIAAQAPGGLPAATAPVLTVAPAPAALPERGAQAPLLSDVVPEPATDAAPERRPAVNPVPSAPPALRRAEAPVSRPRAPVAPITLAPSARVYALNELPENIRRQLPQLTVGGAMYSDNPANRMLILNGQLFHEGDHPIANLKLEQINLKSAVLSYQGYRYGINY